MVTADVSVVAAAATGAAALGVVGAAAGDLRARATWATVAAAIAAGMMLAMADSLRFQGRGLLQVVGAVAAVVLLVSARRRGTAVRASAHSAAEGLAIGVAFAQDLASGLFLCCVVGLHNVPESAGLDGTEATSDGSRRVSRVAFAAASRVPQVLVAVGAAMLLDRVGHEGTRQVLAGGATAGLVFLVVSEVLPSAYRRGGVWTIALAATFALSGVALLRELWT